ncbi:glutamyl-tRNA reductase [Tessaracoccus lapidicaptus]|uniref:glutamyl-tRNA reductase n=1 Tax=Tessaracoccus lapidicaptus TaxID=1427523 RepID=UPI0033416265
MGRTVTMRVFSIQHDRHGLTEVERISADVDGVAARMCSLPDVTGAVVLSTCNRVEVLLDTTGHAANTDLRAALDAQFAEPPAWDLYLGEAALGHLFRVASGLDSMVVGEREIAGQLKRALADAQAAGHTSLPLTIAVDEALRTSRRIANETALEGAGRSVVGVGLSLMGVEDWTRATATIVGTGSYAGAVVAALRHKGVAHIRVHSASGRGSTFADSHDLEHVATLDDALAGTDLVVTCRGLGSPVITPAHVAGPMRLLDLSLQRDVDPAVARVPGTVVVDLASIQASIQPCYAEDTRRAEALVQAGVADVMTRLRSRIVDPAVVGLRDTVMGMVADEVARLPQRQLSHDDAALALRRLATRLLHIPSSRARAAAEQGRTEEYLTAMAELYGIGAPETVDPDGLEDAHCPVTNLQVADLDTPDAQEAM